MSTVHITPIALDLRVPPGNRQEKLRGDMTRATPRRGEIWLVDFGTPVGHEQGYRRPR